MKIINYIIFLGCFHFILIASSCKDKNNEPTRNDSLSILKETFSSPIFQKNFKGLNVKVDTLYVLNEKNRYRIWWPKEIKPFCLNYIEDIEENKRPIISAKSDQRIRLGIPEFAIKNDSARVTLFIFSWNSNDNFTLVKNNGQWKITKVRSGVY